MGSDKIYVAIGEEVEERESTLRWVSKGFMKCTICVIHVLVPAKGIPLPSGRKDGLGRMAELRKVRQILGDCTKICALLQVPCETRFVVKDSIREGILELIHQLRIEKVVMGAAANHKYQRGMANLMSEKAKYMFLVVSGTFMMVLGPRRDKWYLSRREADGLSPPLLKRIDELEEQIVVCRAAVAGSATLREVSTRIKVSHPPKFNGSKDAKEIHSFLWCVERYFDAFQVGDDVTKITTVSMYLVEDAILCWRRRQAKVKQDCAKSGHRTSSREIVLEQSPDTEEMPSNSSEIDIQSEPEILLSEAPLARFKHSVRSRGKTLRSSSSAKTLISDSNSAYTLPIPSSANEDFTEDDMPQNHNQHLGSSFPSVRSYIQIDIYQLLCTEMTFTMKLHSGFMLHFDHDQLSTMESSTNGTHYNQLEQGISEAESFWCECLRESASFSNADKQDIVMEAIHKTIHVKSPCYEELRHRKVMNEEAANRKRSTMENNVDINGTLYNQPEQGISEAESSRCEAYRESASSWNAHRQVMAAIRKAKPVKRPYSESLKLKKAMKEDVTEDITEAANTKRMFIKVSLKLTEALGHKMSLESQVEKLNLKVKFLEKKLFSEKASPHKFKNECNKLQIGKDGAHREAQESRNQLSQGPSTDPTFIEFSYRDLQKATNYFDPSRRIGVGGYVYKGLLHHTQVAIKLLPLNCVRYQRTFDEQVTCLSKLRHANLVTLMGACREPWALVYEYLPGGALEDRPSLPWRMRIHIATSICSALIFFRSAQFKGIFRGDLSPKKLYLDANFTCKITDFSLLAHDMISVNDLEADVYSYGIFVLYLLTGKQESVGIAKEVESALKIGALDSILDPLAGDWPYVQAEQLTHMALRCCDSNVNDRPDLVSDVWRVLAPMQASCSSLS
ncbi:hypothetical protein KSS87_001932 [Heliosperma pusillum]|nr:hypothetical protein KSS87_001932 [Heliosperma pusillum]